MAKKKEDLERELSELKNLVSLLLENKNNKDTNSQEKENIKVEKDILPEIPVNKPIRVLSLFHGVLNLKTSNDSNATVFRFGNYGDIIPIIYNDLIKSLSTQREIFEEGYCYILNEDFIKIHYLEKAYEKILDKTTIDNILNYSDEEITTYFGKTTKQIQETIIDLLLEKLMKNEHVDRNKITLLSKLSGKNLDKYLEHLTGSNNED